MQEYSEHDWAEMEAKCEALAAQIGRYQNLAWNARQLVDTLVCADGPDALWVMVNGGLGKQIIDLDRYLKVIANGSRNPWEEDTDV